MKIKGILSIILVIVVVVSFIIFFRSAQDVDQFTTAVWSCLLTAVSVAILLVWNPWLIGK
ncbi:MAG: hypothetical protein Q8N99_00245 [Nanoarchaeota archaeon]|nr:hypothetical protein [Nanoarchaeota archaeon]